MQPNNSDTVRQAYGEIASQQQDECCGSGGCGHCGDAPAMQAAPGAGAISFPASTAGLSCGNPVELARLQPGETVLDLGSGAGRDVISAARMVGKTGKVYGVDFSREMLALSRDAEQQLRDNESLFNTEFREGDIQDLPFFNGSIDVVLSNCVLNLAPDRARAFSEAHRVLRPGGRLVVSDLVVEDCEGKAGLAGREDASAAYASALSCESYIQLLQDAGFTGVQVLRLNRYAAGQCEGDPVTTPIQDLLLAHAASITLMAFSSR
ncbi:MAG: methyltransferase domain-containing protein [Planctomycetales bacterium]|nr:methyltransferase domain-containing protein [bacterium]UNM07453.1 MAG: methyltransferase domain-containing protein [Planctomycetales bacterium]